MRWPPSVAGERGGAPASNRRLDTPPKEGGYSARTELSVRSYSMPILRYLKVLATTSTAHLFHYSTFLVAEVDGVPAAALCGYFDDELGYAAVSAVGDEVDRQTGRDAAAGEAGLARIAPFVAVLPEHEPHAWVIENVATLPAFRRRGLVDRLLLEIIDRGVKRGATSIDIGVLIGNDPAQRAYEKVGFRVVGEKRNAELEAVWGTPGIRALSYIVK